MWSAEIDIGSGLKDHLNHCHLVHREYASAVAGRAPAIFVFSLLLSLDVFPLNSHEQRRLFVEVIVKCIGICLIQNEESRDF